MTTPPQAALAEARAFCLQRDDIVRFLRASAEKTYRPVSDTEGLHTPTEILKTKFGLDNPTCIALGRKLEAAGLARFIIGRRDHPTRIVWLRPLTDVARAMLDDATGFKEEPLQVDRSRGAIAEAKRMLASAFGIDEGKIEIIIRA